MPASIHVTSALRTRLTLAMRNISRRRQRTALTLGAIAFGVASLIISGGFIQDIYVQLAETLIHSQLGHIQIAKRGYFDAAMRNPFSMLVEQEALRGAMPATSKQVKTSMSRISFSGLLSSGRNEVPVVGEAIESSSENKLGSSMHYLDGKALSDTDTTGIVLGEGVARAMKAKVGDTVTLLSSTPEGALNSAELIVTGVFQSFFKEYDNHAIRVPLSAVKQLLGVRGVHSLVLELDDTAATESTLNALRTNLANTQLEARAWYEISDFYEKTVQMYDRQFGALRLIIFLMVMLAVINVVNMSIFERLGEIGTMRAIGNTSSNVFWLVITESVLLGILGSALGLLAGLGLAHTLSLVGIPMPPPPGSDLGYTARIQIVPAQCAFAFLIGVAASIVASIKPALRASKVSICEALRQAI